MYCVKVLSKLSDRLDAEFYNPKAIETIELMEENGKTVELGEIIKEGYRVVYHGTDSINGLNATEVLPFLSPTRIGVDGDIDFDKVDYLPLYYKNDYPKGLASTGELLIEVKGNVSKVGIVPSAFPKNLMISGSLYKARLNEDRMDPHYVLVFLKSKFGQILKDRLTSNTIINYIAKDALYSIPIFEASYTVQKYIADKVRQAERLRGWAKETERKVNIFHLTFIPKQDHLSFDKKFRNVKSFQMTERLDAHFYPSVVEDYIAENIDSFQNMSEITSSVFNGQTQPEDLLGADTIKQITVANLSSNFLMGEPRFVQELTNSSKFIRKYDLLICNAAHNKSYIGKDITYVHSEDKLLPSTEVMVIRVNRDELPASYVRTYLNTKIGYIQIQSTVRGITAHSYPDDVKTLNIYIPKVCGQQREEWFLQDLYLAKAGLANEYSTKLVEVAKYLVEALIEGILTEEELIQAQNTLEQADPSLDRAILNQMTEDGYAVTGSKPLFADLDEFYDLLEQAKALE